eukprot:g25084.t1
MIPEARRFEDRVTGVNLDRKLLWQNYKICQAGGIAGCCANVQWCLRLMDKSTWKTIPNRFDKRIDDTFLLRCYFVQVELILALLHERLLQTSGSLDDAGREGPRPERHAG